MPTRAEIRRVLNQRFPTIAEFDAFCLDYFPRVASRFADGMDRLSKENLLLAALPIEDLAAVLSGARVEPDLSPGAGAPLGPAAPAPPPPTTTLGVAAAAPVVATAPGVAAGAPVVSGQTGGASATRPLWIVGGGVVAGGVALGIALWPRPAYPPCEIAPPETVHSAAAQKVAGDLKDLASKMPVSGSLSGDARTVLDRSFAAVPESDVVCQMVLQSVVCLANSGRAEMAQEMNSYVATKCPDAAKGLNPPLAGSAATLPAASADSAGRLGSGSGPSGGPAGKDSPAAPGPSTVAEGSKQRAAAGAAPAARKAAGCEPSHSELARGHCAFAQCGQGWVRGSVQVQPDGRVTAEVELETDDPLNGPCGYVSWEVRDAAGNWLAADRTEKQCFSASPAPKGLVRDMDPVQRMVAVDVARRASAVLVQAKCVQ